jgi:hypothetical protein
MGKIRSTNTPCAEPRYQVPTETEAVLVNWARWAAPRTGLRRQRNLLAKMAKPDRWADAEDRHEAPPVFASPPDVDSAWRAEKVLCSPYFDPPSRALLVQHYLHRLDPRRTARLLGIHHADFELELWRAACIFMVRYRHTDAAA